MLSHAAGQTRFMASVVGRGPDELLRQVPFTSSALPIPQGLLTDGRPGATVLHLVCHMGRGVMCEHSTGRPIRGHRTQDLPLSLAKRGVSVPLVIVPSGAMT